MGLFERAKEVDKIRAENYRECLKQIQKYLFLMLGAAVSYILISDINLKESDEVLVPGIFIKLNAKIAENLILALYFATGMMAGIILDAAKRMATILHKKDVELFEAASSYPSLAVNAPPIMKFFVLVLPIIAVGIKAFTSILATNSGDYQRAITVVLVVSIPGVYLLFKLPRSPDGLVSGKKEKSISNGNKK